MPPAASAPIALFAYKRVHHLRQTVEALASNSLAAESDLFVFADGARTAADEADVRAVRDYIGSITGFRSITPILRDSNMGLSASIISGVTELITTHGEVIVVEDDLVTSPYFLAYMNAALRLYRDDERVISVHGYLYPLSVRLPETFFLRGADCWGWATWQRGWDLFEADGRKLLAELEQQKLTRSFDLNGAYPYTNMLRDQVSGRNDSWAIRWHASAFLNGRLTLYPGCSLVRNIGFDASGTHCVITSSLDTILSPYAINVCPQDPVEDMPAKAAIASYLKGQCLPLWKRLLKTLKNQVLP